MKQGSCSASAEAGTRKPASLPRLTRREKSFGTSQRPTSNRVSRTFISGSKRIGTTSGGPRNSEPTTSGGFRLFSCGLDSVRILVLQESDWVAKGPHQGHHLLERMRSRGHKVRVVDFEIRWADRREPSRVAWRRVFPDVHKVVEDGKISVIRPLFLRLPVLDTVSLVFTHLLEVRRQFREFQPDVVVGFGILN